MLFPKLNFEPLVQEGDKLRFHAGATFVNQGEITDVLIKPHPMEQFYSVFHNDPDRWFLDWAYETEGDFLVTVRVEVDTDDKERDYVIEVVSATDEALLSKDGDLYPYEPNIKKYLPLGKSSFIYAHRAARDKILAYLDEQRIWKNNGSRYTKEDLRDVEDDEFRHQFKMWSIFQTLLIIFESSQVSTNDIFQEKRTEYEREMRIHRNRASLRLDSNGDGQLDTQPRNIRTTRLIRR